MRTDDQKVNPYYDGAEMRIVYAITSKVGEPYLQQGNRDTYIIPGAKEDEVHMCDYVLINDQESFFYMGKRGKQSNLQYQQKSQKTWSGVRNSSKELRSIMK